MKKIKAILLVVALLVPCIAALACKESTTHTLSHYQINATYNAEAKQVDATLVLDYINNYDVPLENVKLHLYPRAYREDAKFNAVSVADRARVFPTGISYGDLTVFKVTKEGNEQDIVLEGQDDDILVVDAAVQPGESVKIEIDFRVDLPTGKHRLGYYDGVANLGNWYPIACVYKNGQFDTAPYYNVGDPFVSEVADYTVTITTPKTMVAATSGTQSASVDGNSLVTTSQIKNARDFALVIGAFNVASGMHDGVRVNYYYVNDSTPNESLTTAYDSLRTFGEAFGEYAYEALSVVKTPFCYGGMEYPGLIYINDNMSEEFHKEVIIHEIAHQWWYAAVGSDQINEAWLDEGLTEYTTTYFYEVNPSYGTTREKRLGESMTGYLLFLEQEKQNGKGDTSMNRSVYNFADSWEYNCMTYVKGQIMLDELRTNIGTTSFFRGLRNYYGAYKFKIAGAADFIGIMESSSVTSLQGFFDSFLEGKVKMQAK